MPGRVVDKTMAALSERQGRALKGARTLVIGVAYKKNIDDMRESPALRIMELSNGVARRSASTTRISRKSCRAASTRG